MVKKKLSKIGTENEQRFVDLRKSQGYLSFKRNRLPYGAYDMWKTFDVLSMNSNGIELTQVKTADSRDTRGAMKQVREWMEENKAMIPEGTVFTVAVWVTPDEEFYIKEVILWEKAR